ncbi:lns2 (lipin ned1 smp2) protein [Cystoisospora suis]|uniref:phosphatidate phosphatase n=1 Tax=Cystoisospora suis TaxID=483139 RepID=A0A2C6LB63_9APIC|nr:lns2 (lipin ned1 smp2) protein [Cystoisospora suis]
MWGKIVSSVSNALDFNQATLSGCIDIICVRSTLDNKLRSTPFHVRFGKAKLLRSREKVVTVTVNGQPTDLLMKLGAAGEAYFVQEEDLSSEAGGGDEGDDNETGSPGVLSPRSNTSGGGGSHEGLGGGLLNPQQSSSNSNHSAHAQNSSPSPSMTTTVDSAPPVNGEQVSKPSLGPSRSSGDRKDLQQQNSHSKEEEEEIRGETGRGGEGGAVETYHTTSSLEPSSSSSSANGGGEKEEDKQFIHEVAHGTPQSDSTAPPPPHASLPEPNHHQHNGGVHTPAPTGGVSSSSRGSHSGQSEEEKKSGEGETSPLAQGKSRFAHLPPEAQQIGAGPVQDSTVEADIAAGAASGVSFSLCGHMLTGRITEEQHDNDVFNANVVSWESFDQNPALWFHPSLVARFDDKPPYYPGKVALPLLACWLVFNRPLSLPAVSRLMSAEVTAKFPDPSSSSWFFGGGGFSPFSHQPHKGEGRGPSSGSSSLPPSSSSSSSSHPFLGKQPTLVFSSKNSIAQATASAAASVAAVEEEAGIVGGGREREEEGEWREGGALVSSGSFHSEDGGGASGGSGLLPSASASTSCTACATRRLRRSLRPTPDQLEALNLKPGANSICFTVSSSLQGTKSVSATIYLWPQYPKIVISDVDGTITRSDVLGQLMPIVGRDWSHDGVAELFTKIKKAGYLILYLTARAIGQADATRDYLFGLTQQQTNKLPGKKHLPSLAKKHIERRES